MSNSKFNPDDPRMKELARQITAASSMVKICVGIGNNAAWSACLDAYDHIKQHPRYRQQIKGGTTPAREFKRCFDMLHQYERNLIYTEHNRFFHVADMPEDTRRLYGNITDRDYYDFWASFGAQAYNDQKPFFTSLVNKIRIANIHIGEKEPEIMAWATGAQCALDIAAHIFQTCMTSTIRHIPGVREESIRHIFSAFDLKSIADFWDKSTNTLSTPAKEPDPTDIKNIKDGMLQLEQKWTNNDSLFGSRIKTAEDYAEIFRTNGTCKKMMREFAEMKEEMENSAKF